LIENSGLDVTDLFDEIGHSESAIKAKEKFYIGDFLPSPSIDPAGADKDNEVIWKWLGNDNRFVPYPPDINLKIEAGFQNSAQPTFLIRQQEYYIDFKTMNQHRVRQPHVKRTVKREFRKNDKKEVKETEVKEKEVKEKEVKEKEVKEKEGSNTEMSRECNLLKEKVADLEKKLNQMCGSEIDDLTVEQLTKVEFRLKKSLDLILEAKKKKLKADSDKLTCKICEERPTIILFLPCGHLCCCDICSTTLTLCPMCRTEINSKVKAFIG